MYNNHIFVDIFNIGMLLILSGSGFTYFYLLYKRYKERKATPVLSMAMASLGIGGGAIFLVAMYLSGQLSEFNFSEIISGLGTDQFRVEPYMFFTILLISMVDVSMFEFMHLIFEIPNKKMRKKIYLAGVFSLAFPSLLYLLLYFVAILLTNEFAWFVIFVETFIIFIGIIAVLIILYGIILRQGYRVLKKIDKEHENYDKIKYMSLWCLFGGLFFVCIIIVMFLQLYGIEFGLVLSLAVASSYCVYRAYIKR